MVISMKRNAAKRANAVNATKAVCGYILEIYLFVIFVIYPYYHKNGFVKMGFLKYTFFRTATLVMFACMAAAIVCYIIALRHAARQKPGKKQAGKKRAETKKEAELPKKKIWQMLSPLDYAVLAYAVFAVISWLFSDFRAESWKGADGWYMGLEMQLAFVLLYAVTSRFFIKNARAAYYLLAGSALAFLFGIGHRFMIDPLHMYDGLKDWQMLQFLSTLGQATWYSSFVCAVYPVGVFLFWYCQNKKYRIGAGIYAALAFATLVTQNSDSAYISLAAVMAVLFGASFASNEKMKRFLELLLLMLADFKIIGLLQMLFRERAVQLDAISVFLSQGTAGTIALLIVVAVYAGFFRLSRAGKFSVADFLWARNAAAVVLAAAGAGLIIFVAINTHNINTGKAGIYHQYLYFNEAWGNGRGMTWRHTVSMWKDFSFGRKLIGVGPDAYSAYSYSIPEYADKLYAAWGDAKLTNSHNEWMNVFICYGLLGAFSYIGIFVTAIVRFARAGARHNAPLAFAVTLCALSYMGHNLFCYQQTLCTPFIFLLFGMAEAMCRE